METHCVDPDPINWSFHIPQPATAVQKTHELFQTHMRITFEHYGNEGKMSHCYGEFPVEVSLDDQPMQIGNGVDPKGWRPCQPAPDVRLRRYMNYEKFCSLLETSALFFALVEKMPDKDEGFMRKPDSATGCPASKLELKVHSLFSSFFKRSLIVCWNDSHDESAFMWRAYAGPDGVAIETTLERLERSIGESRPISYGKIKYVDDKEWLSMPNLGIAPLFLKGAQYSKEDEVRAVLPGPAYLNQNDSCDLEKVPLDCDVSKEGGRLIKVDLIALVENVVLHPNASDSFRDQVECDVRKANLPACVKPSTLSDGL